MAQKLLVIFGATGNQGGSVARLVLKDPELSKQYVIRGVTRDPTKDNAKALVAMGAQVVAADLSDPSSVKSVLEGAHTVFAMSATGYGMPTSVEFEQGKLIADASVAASAKYLIWSTLARTKEISGGKYTKIEHFDIKKDVEDYIRTLPIRSAFFSPGTFMSNFVAGLKPRPSHTGDGTYVMTNVVDPSTKYPLIDTEGDSGKWVGAILADPDKFEGKIVVGSTRLHDQEEVAAIYSKVTGKTVRYQQVSVETWKSFIPPAHQQFADGLAEMILYFQDFGYWGPSTKEQIEWSNSQARGTPTTFEEFLTREKAQLD